MINNEQHQSTNVAATNAEPVAASARKSKKGRSNFEQFIHLVALIILLIVAVATTIEISSRNEDYARVAGHYKWLLSCLQQTIRDKSCPNDAPKEAPKEEGSLQWRLDVAATQVRRYESLNSIGTGTKCMTARVIASPDAGFYEACVAAVRNEEVSDSSHQLQLAAILKPPLWSFNRAPISMDQRPKDELYFILVLVSATIGSLIAGLRSVGFSTHYDLTIGIGAGFAVYLIIRSGNFAFLSVPVTNIDILNPYSAAAVGMLVGLFGERVFRSLDGVLRRDKASATQDT